MIVAYLDEFGHVGPYISTAHKKFKDHPLFGYAGIVLPEASIRSFGAKFEQVKARQFRSEIVKTGKHPRRWEKKGAEMFTTGAYSKYPERVDFISDLADYMARLGGKIFFYGEEKPAGTEKETGQSAADRTRAVLTESVRRLCRYADLRGENLTIFLDKGGPMPREEAITSLAQFIYASPDPPMKRIVEVPMELESHRYGAVQFADWMCAIASRATHFHFSDSDEFSWAPNVFGAVFNERALDESRIWLPSQERPVRAKAIKHTRKWRTSESASAIHHGAHMTQRIRDAMIISSR
ncbi:DUF3800 domain-containing protein [Schaalia hyovaginalis]|uniref:DUF3800 domain-containing protein n=1 Tax=Schaalia hyovaginalis TaxID=29316 RepID=UPI002A75728D|nr:DUF3800 domain-containing protein [Schaalia hyovaginalis]MDY2669804.1 DUF3800 domain-containing protein [Schaalia hyovaginalis]